VETHDVKAEEPKITEEEDVANKKYGKLLDPFLHYSHFSGRVRRYGQSFKLPCRHRLPLNHKNI
jgi:hypothetical protein